MLEFLSDTWFGVVRDVVTRIQPALGPRHTTIRWEVGAQLSVAWCLHIDNGRLTVSTRKSDTVDDTADVTLRCGPTEAFEILSGQRTGADAIAATMVLAARSDGAGVTAVPPFGLATESPLAALPHLPGANLCVHLTLTTAPFGTTECSLLFRDGHLRAVPPGHVGEPDVAVNVPYRGLMRFFRDEMSWQEMLQHGRLGAGSLESLLFLAGIVESPAWRDATVGCTAGRAPQALVHLGELGADEQYRRALVELMGRTAPPDASTRVLQAAP